MAASKIIVSGLTAAGKTTHARLLVARLGWRYLGMSSIMRAMSGVATNPREWSLDVDQIRGADERIDVRADQEMSKRVSESETPIVVDAWLQPWLYQGEDALRVWLSSSFHSRLMKAQVSYLRDGEAIPPGTEDLLCRKDQFSIDRFRSLYGLDFGPQSGGFDVVIDNSSYISEASIAQSDKGIIVFDTVLWDEVRVLL